MLTALRQRNFALLWTGGLVSLIGDWMLFVGLPVYVYSLTNSALITGITFMISTLPKVLLGSVAGVFADRWDRKRLMIVCDLVRAAAVLVLLTVRTADSIWIVYIVAGVMSVVSQFFNPAQSALVPQLVDKQTLVGANSANSLSSNLTRLLGPAIGGVLVAWYGFTVVIAIDSVSFLLSALLISLILPGRSESQAAAGGRPAASANPAGVWHEWLAGLKLVRQNNTIAVIFLIIAILMPAEGILQVLFVLFVDQRLGGGAEAFGLLLTAQGIGGLLGSLLVGRIGQRIPPRLMIGASAVLNGLILLVIFNVATFQLALALFALAGLPVVAMLISVQTLLQQNTPEQYLGRVFGAFSTTIAIMALLGMGLASGLADRIGILPMLNLEAGLNILAGLVAFGLMQSGAAPLPNREASQAS